MTTYSEKVKPSEAINTQWDEDVIPDIGVGGWFASWFVIGWFEKGSATGVYTEDQLPESNYTEET